jgi:hypothetical protein
MTMSYKRARALAMVRTLYEVSERHNEPRWWSGIDIVVTRNFDDQLDPDQLEALNYAIQQGWIDISPGRQTVCLSDSGRRLAQRRFRHFT